MDIPKHIKYLSFIFFLNAAIAIVIGGLSLASVFHAVLTEGELAPGFSIVLSKIAADFGLMILFTLLAIFSLIFLGINLRKLKPWARTVTLVYSALTILFSLFSLLMGEGNFSYHFLVQVYAVWVLTRPEIKRAFQT